MAKVQEHRMGFTVWTQPRPGLAFLEELAFTRRVEDYLADRGLRMSGGPLSALVWSDERSLTAADQVDLLVRLVRDPVVERVAVSPLVRASGHPADRDSGYVVAQSLDVGVIALTILYECSRLSAELYLQILGGFVRPAVVH